MKINMIGAFVRNAPFGTEIAFKKGLEQIGVSVFTWDPSQKESQTLRNDADATIVFKDQGEYSHVVLRDMKTFGQTVIEYQPDDIRAPGIRGMMEHMREFCDYAFTFDKEGARVANEIGYKKAKKLLLTADPDLYRPLGLLHDIDFCFIGSLSNPVMHESRNKMIRLLTAAGHNVVALSIFDPEIINAIYNRSKIVLNHATDVGQDFGWGYGYQCRHFEAGFAGSCLLSNSLLDNDGDGPEQFCTFNSEEELLEDLNLLLDGWYDGPINEQQGKALLQELMEGHTPQHRAREIVQFIEEVRECD